MKDARFEKLCASSGISVLLTQSEKSRNIRLNSRASRFLNWSLCPTSVEERLALRSRVSAPVLTRCERSRECGRWTHQKSNIVELMKLLPSLMISRALSLLALLLCCQHAVFGETPPSP